ncbi:MAG: AAA family ATPase [Actinobacteria bacterium]|nr:AAA family ATPase [Actinomycetota bacterium]MBV9252826.1 AAA family ATPase [Actinomycetota bacterium]
MAELKMLGGTTVMQAAADVAAARERARRARVHKLMMIGLLAVLWWCARQLAGNPVRLGMPHVSSSLMPFLPGIALILLMAVAFLGPMLGMGRSPHVLYRPSEIDISLEDVKGADVVVDEVVKTLNLFLAHKTFKERMGGTPRRAILFEGPPGTGKTYMAKAMAREAGVPFLFVSSSAFQSMYYGQTNRKIRSYFKALRAYARREGGAIGFIEEIDAIGAARAGMGASTNREGISGVVNELLIQLQSFDQPTRGMRVYGWFIDGLNRWLPAQRQLRKPKPHQANILVIGATNRAKDLDPALLRPGRFDRSVFFDLPSRTGRREIIDYYLDKKAHEPELDDEDRRNSLAAQTSGYSPVMIEHVLDEALVWALRRGAESMAWRDIQRAKLTEEIGLGQPVEYTEAERRTIATHESGHAAIAYLAGTTRKLDVLSIIKRAESLGLMGHSETEERFLRTQAEIEAHIQISLGGLVAEELFFGETTTGPSADLAAATNAAAMMVGSLGMAGSLLSYEAVQTGGPANLTAKVVATDEGRERIEAILVENKARVEQLLGDNRHIVEALRDALLERDELIAGEILDVIYAAEREVRGQILDLRPSS